MSNGVDILLVGGPHDGVVLCQPKPIPMTVMHKEVPYTTRAVNRVHVATYSDADIPDAPNAIVVSGLQPSWDLPA